MHETGCRPHEARIVEAKDFDKANRRFVMRRMDSKGKQSRRVIRLNDRAFEIASRLTMKWQNGPIFRNKLSRPWTRHTLRSRFHDLGKKMGVRLFPYILRHTWATDSLLRGVAPLTVAIFMGHTDASMIMKVYSHLVQNDEFLAAQLRKATGETDLVSQG